MMVENPDREIRDIEWEDFGFLLNNLVEKIKGLGFNSVYGIPFNGTIIAGIIAKKLNVTHVLHKNDITFTTLIVDDISDTGNTLKEIKMRYGANETATLHVRKTSKCKPNYFVEEINEEWIKYPWEVELK